MEHPIKGSCQCGSVTYEATEDPVLSLICHCMDCQKLSASAYSTTLVFKTGTLTVNGELRRRDRVADSGRPNAAYFCPTCGNRIYHQDPENPGPIRLKCGHLDSIPIPAPQAHVWVSRKQPWVEIEADMPTFPENAPAEALRKLMV